MSTGLMHDSGVEEILAPSTAPKQPGIAAWKKYALYGLAASLYLLPFMPIYLLGTDEGTLDYGAVRIVQGQVFTRDFFEVIGPGTFYSLAAFFKLFGVSFLVSRVYLFLISLGTALLMYFLSRRLCRTHQALASIFLAATSFGLLWPEVGHHTDSNFYALITAACVLLWYDRRSTKLLFAAGAFAGITSVVFQPKGFLLFVALLVWLLILRKRRETSLSSLGPVTIGYLAILILIALAFWSKGAFRSLVYVNFVWPLFHYQAVNTVTYAGDVVLNFRNHVVEGITWTIPLAAVLVTPFLFIAAFPVLLPAIGARLRWNLKQADVLLFWLCGAALFGSEWHRKDIAHLVFGSPFLMILCVHFLTEYRGRIATLTLQLLSIGCVSLAVFNLLCVLFGAHSLTTSVGKIRVFTQDGALAFEREHVAPGEEIFAYRFCPRYYFLGAAKNPTPYSLMIYGYNTTSQFQEVVRILEERKVKYVFWDTNLEQVMPDAFPSANDSSAAGFIIEPYLESHYRVVQVANGTRIMERKE
jgi:4-amino-4-deoxy-L-arabinose transferase-like glycosyltransferase